MGKWNIHANGLEGEFSIDSVRNNRVEGKLLGARVTGFYDEKTKCLSLVRYAQNGAAVQSYKGYLSIVNEPRQVRYTIAGTFQAFADEAGTGAEFGWVAVLARPK